MNDRQLSLTPDLFGFTPPPGRQATPREIGKREGAKSLRAAVANGFDSDGARRFIVSWVRRHGPTSGENLTDAAKGHGFNPGIYGRDDRAFGPVFAAALREPDGLVVIRSDLIRAKGRGTSGGKLYGAAA